jgi:hypothetical protein
VTASSAASIARRARGRIQSRVEQLSKTHRARDDCDVRGALLVREGPPLDRRVCRRGGGVEAAREVDHERRRAARGRHRKRGGQRGATAARSRGGGRRLALAHLAPRRLQLRASVLGSRECY